MKKIIELHKFFVKESKSYMQGTNRWYYYSRYLFAYFNFMYYSLNDLS